MVLSILILCIVSMTSFNPVASSNTPQLSSDSAPIFDFGFTQLINDLILAKNDSSNRKSLLAIFSEVDNQIKSLGVSNNLISEIVGSSWGTDHFLKSTDDIENWYELTELYVKTENIERITLEKLAEKLASIRSDSLSHALYMFAENHEDFMKALIENMKNKTKTGECLRTKKSPQYEIYDIYHKSVITAVKGFAMRIYAWNMEEKFHEEDYAAMKEIERKDYVKALRNFRKSVVSAMTQVSRDICSSDKSIDRRGRKYIELKWLFNTIVINEAYLNEDSSCWQTCAHYQNTSFHQYAPVHLDKLNICNGRIYNCIHQTVNSYCPATKNSRRFDGFLPTKMGQTNCFQKHNISNKIPNGLFDVCEQCICYCDDYNRSDTVRTFSLRAVESDTSKNRVITGIQFVEKNEMIYLRIQEGELKPNGTIDESTVKWQPINEFDHKSSSTSSDDFFTITYDQKFVNLDTLVAPAGRVLTGIKLGAQGSHLAMQIETHAFNYTTGILKNGSHIMIGKDGIARKEITMIAPDNPTHMNQSFIDTRENTYVTFRMTDLEKDVGQTAIPFIDALPVVSDPPVPYSGVGIYYSGQTGYGGFIGLKVVAYDHPEVIGN